MTLSVSAEPNSVEVSGTVVLTATVSGEGAEASEVMWSAAEGDLSADVGATVTWTAPASAGTYEVTAALTTAALTGGGSTVTATASVEVTPAITEPAGLGVSVVGNTEAVYGETVTLTAVVSGEGADAATVSWDATAGVLSSATGLATEWTAPAAAGPVTLTASIDGHEATGTLEVEVRLCDAGDWVDAAEPCLISSVVQLQAIHEHLDGHFAMDADLDANGTVSWHDGAGFLPIGAEIASGFRGSLDGGGHTISGLHIDRTDLHDVGLFAVIGTGGEVRDLQLVGLDVVGQGYTGGLAGHNRGVISSVHSAGAVLGEVLPGAERTLYTGGLLGYNSGTVQDSSSEATVSAAMPEPVESPTARVGGLVGGNHGLGAISRSFTRSPGVYSPADISGSNVGGLVASNWGTIEDSYSLSSVEADSGNAGGLVGNNLANQGAGGLILRSFTGPAASVTGTWSVGGLAGISFGHIEDSYSLADPVQGTGSVGGLVGSLRKSPQPGYEHLGLVIESFSMSPVQGGTDAGGLVGEAAVGTLVERSVWDVQRSDQATSAGGGTGVGTAQMLHAATFSGWDFGAVWTIDEGRDPPNLIANPRPTPDP